MAELKTRIILRNDTHNNWEAVKGQVILKKGELGVDFDPTGGDYRARLKIGDGSSTWQQLEYFGEFSPSEIEARVAALEEEVADIYTIIGDEASGLIKKINDEIARAKAVEATKQDKLTASAGITISDASVIGLNFTQIILDGGNAEI